MTGFWHFWIGNADDRPTFFSRHLVHWLGCRLDLHKFVGADLPGCFHTHPAVAVRLVLWGGYTEEMEDGRHRTWVPGMVGVIRPADSHRVATLLNGRSSWSLWLRFRVVAEVRLRGPGWRDVLAGREPVAGAVVADG